MVRTKSSGWSAGVASSGVPFAGMRALIGTEPGLLGRLASAKSIPARSLSSFAHADNSAAADIDAGAAHAVEGFETIVERPVS